MNVMERPELPSLTHPPRTYSPAGHHSQAMQAADLIKQQTFCFLRRALHRGPALGEGAFLLLKLRPSCSAPETVLWWLLHFP